MPETRMIPNSSIWGPAGPARVALEVFGDDVYVPEQDEVMFIGDIVALHWQNPNNADAIFTARFKTSNQTETLTLSANTPEWQRVPVPQNFSARSDGFATNLGWGPVLPTAASNPGGGKPGKPR